VGCHSALPTCLEIQGIGINACGSCGYFVHFNGIIVALYVLSYSFLSVRGAYGPFTSGTNGIKEYAWYPLGYLDQSNHWRMLPFKSYFPVWVLDGKYWHDDWTGQSVPRIPAMPEKAPKATSPSS
jgi:hypothetical protein